jgi:hypothetical protein
MNKSGNSEKSGGVGKGVKAELHNSIPPDNLFFKTISVNSRFH